MTGATTILKPTDLADDDAYFQLIVDVVALQAASLVRWPDIAFDPIELFERLRARPRSVHAVTWELLLLAGARRGAGVVMDKSLDSVHYADELLRLFDDARFLSVVRDPRAQVSSMNRAIIHDFDTLPNAVTWARAHDAARALAARHPDRVLTVRYEDFLHDQETVLRAICAFCGIAFLPGMLDVSQSTEAQQLATRSALWESNASPPLIANRDKFKATLAPRELEIIETLAGDHMAHYGYARMTSGTIEITPEMTAAAAARSAELCDAAWRELRARNPRDYQLRMLRADTLAMIRTRVERRVERSAAR